MLQLELRLNPTTGELRFYDPSARRILPSYQEQQVELAKKEVALKAEIQARQTAEQRARATELELERLKAELARLNAGQA